MLLFTIEINSVLEYTLFAFAIYVITFIVNKILNLTLNRWIIASAEKLDIDTTRLQFFLHAVVAILYFSASLIIIYSIPSLKTVAVSMLAGAGVFAAILGFASQQAFSNIVGGIFIVIFRPFRVGDRVKVNNDYYGIVEDITIRHTILINFENNRIVIPNSIVGSATIINYNYNDHKLLKLMKFRVDFKTDLDLALEIINNEVVNHKFCLDTRTDEQKENNSPIIEIYTTGWGQYGIDIQVFAWTENPSTGFILATDCYKNVKIAFDKAGFHFPIPIQDINLIEKS